MQTADVDMFSIEPIQVIEEVLATKFKLAISGHASTRAHWKFHVDLINNSLLLKRSPEKSVLVNRHHYNLPVFFYRRVRL